MEGWRCPVCGRGLSPYLTVCPCDGRGVQYEYSSTSNPGECQHQWVTYNGTVPYRQCRRCMKYESLPVQT